MVKIEGCSMTETVKLWLAAVFAMTAQLSILADAITDLSGYVYLKSPDSGGGSSFNAVGQWSDGRAPEAGKHYLVNSTGKQLRLPNLAGGTLIFAGDTLTLDGSEFLFKGSGYAYAHWIVYGGSKMSNGEPNAQGHICGDMACYAYEDKPITLIPPPGRPIYIDADLRGDEDVAICASPVDQPGDTTTAEVKVYVRGNNADYAGSFVMTRGTCNNKTTIYRLCMGSQSALGAANSQRPKLTLAGPNVALCAENPIAFGSGYDLSVSDIAYIESPNTLCAGLSGYGVCESLYFGEGVKISGSGDAASLILRNCQATFGKATVGGLSELAGEASATLRLTRDCDADGVPLRICGLGEFDATGLAAVRLQGGVLSAGIGNGGVGRCGCESLAIDNGTLRFSVVQNGETIINDVFEIAGNLTIAADQTVRIVFDALPALAAGYKLPLITAANIDTLGTASFSLDNSELSTDIEGSFSVEPIGGKNYLVFNYGSGSADLSAPVSLTASDDQNDSSFAAAGHWSDRKAPHANAEYVLDDTQLRCFKNLAVFAGRSLTVKSGGSVAIGAVAVQFDDLRLHAGSWFYGIRDGDGNRLYGSATLLGDGEAPVTFGMESGSTKRSMTIPMTFKGNGALVFSYHPVSDKMLDDPNVGYAITGNNSAFAGSVELAQYGIYTEFTDEKAMGGPAAEFSSDRLRFTEGAELRVRSGYVMQDATRGICFGEGGGTINVYEGQTLKVGNRICGTSKIVKKGEGTLEFCGAGDGFTGIVDHRRGTLAIGSDGVFGTLSGVVCNNSAIWRIGAQGGLKVATVDAIDTTGGKLRLRSDIIDASLAAGESGYVRAKLLTVQSATVDQTQDLIDKIEYVPARELKEGEGPLVIKCFNRGGKLSVYCCFGVNRGGLKVIVR